MKTLVRYISSLLDSLGVLALLVAAGYLVYAIKVPQISLSEQYFSYFFSFLWGAVGLFIISRLFQFTELLVQHGMLNTAKAETNVYTAAKTAR